MSNAGSAGPCEDPDNGGNADLGNPGLSCTRNVRRGGTADARNCPRFRLDRTGPRGRAAAGPDRRGDPPGVTRALPLLEKGSAGYVAQRDCFSCHHQAVPSFALDLARRRGFEVDADNLAEQTELTHSDLSSALDSYKKGEGQGGGGTRAGYALWMLALGGHEADEVTGAVAGYILGREPERGHWRTSSNRPPSESSPFTTTFVALRGLQTFSPRPRRSGSTSGPRRSAPGWRRPSRTTTRSGSSGSGD